MSVLFDVTDANFDALIDRAQGPVLLEVGAPRCGPCRELVRVLEALADEVQPQVRLATTNADTEVDLAARLKIRSLPTLLVFRDGVEVERRCGYAGSRSVQALVRELVASAG